MIKSDPLYPALMPDPVAVGREVKAREYDAAHDPDGMVRTRAGLYDLVPSVKASIDGAKLMATAIPKLEVFGWYCETLSGAAFTTDPLAARKTLRNGNRVTPAWRIVK